MAKILAVTSIYKREDGAFRCNEVYYEKDGEFFVGEHPREDFHKYNAPPLSELRNTKTISLLNFPSYDESIFGTSYTRPPSGCHVRRPHIVRITTESGAPQVRHEALVYDAIRKCPHPRLITPFGCWVRQGRVVAFLFRKLKCTLNDAVEADPGINIDAAFRDIRSAVDHLHHLGFCHNDIHMNNVMFDDERNAYLIDYEYAYPEGNELLEINKTSSKKNDFDAIQRMQHEVAAMQALLSKRI